MTDKQLREDLEKLRQEVNELTENDFSAREKLNALIGDIETRLETSGEETDDESLFDQIKEAISHFETEHPRATGILNDIMVTLSNMGI